MAKQINVSINLFLFSSISLFSLKKLPLIHHHYFSTNPDLHLYVLIIPKHLSRLMEDQGMSLTVSMCKGLCSLWMIERLLSNFWLNTVACVPVVTVNDRSISLLVFDVTPIKWGMIALSGLLYLSSVHWWMCVYALCLRFLTHYTSWTTRFTLKVRWFHDIYNASILAVLLRAYNRKSSLCTWEWQRVKPVSSVLSHMQVILCGWELKGPCACVWNNHSVKPGEGFRVGSKQFELLW